MDRQNWTVNTAMTSESNIKLILETPEKGITIVMPQWVAMELVNDLDWRLRGSPQSGKKCQYPQGAIESARENANLKP